MNLNQESEKDSAFAFGPLPPSPNSSLSPAMGRITEVTEDLSSSSADNDSVPKTEVEVIDFKTKKDKEELQHTCMSENVNVDSSGKNEQQEKTNDFEFKDDFGMRTKSEILQETKSIMKGDKDSKHKTENEGKQMMNGSVKKGHREKKERKEGKDEASTKLNGHSKEKREKKEKKSEKNHKKSERRSRKEKMEKEQQMDDQVKAEEEARERSRSREVGERLARHEHQCSHAAAVSADMEPEVTSLRSSACDCPAYVHDRESPLQIAEVRDAVRVSRTLKNSEPSRFNF